MTQMPFVVGHRGAADLAPENTLAGIRRAHAEGATWVEVDVKLSACGTPVLFHDDTLERTTDGTGPVHGCDVSALRSLDAGSWFGADFSGERVPTLIETLAVLDDLDLGANIELKPSPGMGRDTADAVVQVLRENWPSSNPTPIVSSFNMDVLAVIRDAFPSVERAPLFYWLPNDWRGWLEELGACAVHLSSRHVTKRDIEMVRASGFPVRVFTVNDPVRADQLREWGVTSIFTDRPDLLKD